VLRSLMSLSHTHTLTPGPGSGSAVLCGPARPSGFYAWVLAQERASAREAKARANLQG
jgi:hypothetical protein